MVPMFYFPPSVEDSKQIKAATFPTSTQTSQAVLMVHAFQSLMSQSAELQGADDVTQEMQTEELDSSDSKGLQDKSEPEFVSRLYFLVCD